MHSRFLDDLRQKLADAFDEVQGAESLPLRRGCPWRCGLEKRRLGRARLRSTDALRTLVVVWLARTVVSMVEGVASAFEDFEPQVSGFCCTSGEHVGLRQDA